MKLGSDHIVTPNNGSDRTTIVAFGNKVGAIVDHHMIGMDEIGMAAIGADLDAVKQRVIVNALKRVPADLRDFKGFYPAG